MEQENALKIAVIEEKIVGIREQAKAHADSTNNRFDEVNEKLDILMETLNKGKGAYAVLFLLSGVIGAAFIKFASLVIESIK